VTREKTAMTEGVGHSCPTCGRVYSTSRGMAIHRNRSHGIGPEHGTRTAYVLGCRCERCRKAGAEGKRRDRRNVRPIDGSPETLRACLVSFGVVPERLTEALRSRTIEDLHWYAFRASGELRKHCRCEPPREVAEELGEAS
jgi:hypothetical protein